MNEINYSEQDDIITDEQIEARIKRYEEMFGMTSEEFLKLHKVGKAPDIFETIDWAIHLKHR